MPKLIPSSIKAVAQEICLIAKQFLPTMPPEHLVIIDQTVLKASWWLED